MRPTLVTTQLTGPLGHDLTVANKNIKPIVKNAKKNKNGFIFSI